MQIMARSGEVTEAHHAKVAAMLAGASDLTTESADIVMGIHRIVGRLAEHPGDRSALRLCAAPRRRWPGSPAPAAGAAGAEYQDYLRRHGHRSMRELELRQPEWRARPAAGDHLRRRPRTSASKLGDGGADDKAHGLQQGHLRRAEVGPCARSCTSPRRPWSAASAPSRSWWEWWRSSRVPTGTWASCWRPKACWPTPTWCSFSPTPSWERWCAARTRRWPPRRWSGARCSTTRWS